MSHETAPGARLAALACPLPVEGDRVTLAHGAGAGASARLFEERVHAHLANPALDRRHDGALLDLGPGRVAISTDTFVVDPPEFPGGDLGSLAVHGTVNDLAMCGASPRALTCGLVLEEGLPLAALDRIVASLGRAARTVGVPVVTGDTKVVERGKGDGVFINTTGVGVAPPGRDVGPHRVRPGDVLLLSGPIAEHGVAVLSVREGIGLEGELASDSAPLHELVSGLFAAVRDVHCLRDPTRGGVGAAVCEIASTSGTRIVLDESAIPVREPVRAACELLGLDPLFLACEGRCLVFVPEAEAEAALHALAARPEGRGAARVGRVEAGAGRVVLETAIGGSRVLVLPPGEPLPRIC